MKEKLKTLKSSIIKNQRLLEETDSIEEITKIAELIVKNGNEYLFLESLNYIEDLMNKSSVETTYKNNSYTQDIIFLGLK